MYLLALKKRVKFFTMMTNQLHVGFFCPHVSESGQVQAGLMEPHFADIDEVDGLWSCSVSKDDLIDGELELIQKHTVWIEYAGQDLDMSGKQFILQL